MRLASVILAILLASVTYADDKLAKQYSGRVVMSPDPPPTVSSELAAYVKANATKDDAYDAIKGSPWVIHFVGFLSADAPKVTIEIADGKPLHELEINAKRRLVLGSVKLTTAAGFEANKTYTVRLVAAKKVLAKATLHLRD
jgi:hypothetical protein